MLSRALLTSNISKSFERPKGMDWGKGAAVRNIHIVLTLSTDEKTLQARNLVDILTLHNSSKRIPNLAQRNLDELIRGNTWNVSITNSILSHEDIKAKPSTISRSCRNANMCLYSTLAKAPHTSLSSSVMRTMYPTRTIFLEPIPSRCCCKSVPAKELG